MKFARTPRALLHFFRDRFSSTGRISAFLLLTTILTIPGAEAQPNTVTVVVPGTAAPWSCGAVNPGYVYGGCGSASPVVLSAANGLSFQPGDSLTVTYVSGMASQYGTCPNAYCYDANGFGAWNDTYDSCCGYLPSKYIPPTEYPVGVMTLVGVFANSNGAIVGAPHRLGKGPTILVVPKGATQFQMGVNDDVYGDNNGSFKVSVSGTASIKLMITLDALNSEPSKGLNAPYLVKVGANVTVTDQSGQPVPDGFQVRFKSRGTNVAVSGHEHFNFDLLHASNFQDTSGNSTLYCSTVSGACRVFYIAPEVSGIFEVTASSDTDPTIAPSPAAITVGIARPDWQSLLAPSVPVTYELTGQFGRIKCNGGTVTSQHSDNHWATTSLTTDVEGLAAEYNLQSGGAGILGVNDMSLPMGGLFDINNDWLGPHFLHRSGRSADIDPFHSNDCSPVKKRLLKYIAETTFGLRKIPEPNSIHFDILPVQR